MCENNITNKRTTPLRNSNSANKPFRSPLSTVLTPINNHSPKNTLRQSPLTKAATPKRFNTQFRLPIKRRRIEDATSDELSQNSEADESRNDVSTIERRIRDKRQQLDKLKTELNYLKKHRKEDLKAQIDKWRSACKEALFEFHKDIRDKASKPMSMGQVLIMLGISEETIKFEPDECDLS